MPRWLGELIEVGFVVVFIGIVVGIINSLWQAVFVKPREDRIKLAAEQTKKAELELQRERVIRKRMREAREADDIEVIDDGEPKWEVVEDNPKQRRKVDDDQ